MYNFIGQRENFDLYSKWYGKPLEGWEEGVTVYDLILNRITLVGV